MQNRDNKMLEIKVTFYVRILTHISIDMMSQNKIHELEITDKSLLQKSTA